MSSREILNYLPESLLSYCVYRRPADRALTVRLDDTLEHAVSLVRRGIWRHLPVVDYYGRLKTIARAATRISRTLK